MRGSFNSKEWAAIPLRLIVGYGFMEHGYAKFVKGPEWFANILQALHVPAPHMMAWLTILVELFGGAAVLTGDFIRVASIPMVAVLLVAMFSVHLRYGFSSIKLMAITPTGARLGSAGIELIYFTLPAWWHLCLVAQVHSPSTINLLSYIRSRTT